MHEVINPFKGTNKICAQCTKTCKQFENVTLINCPMITLKSPKKAAKDKFRDVKTKKV